jgi:BirA family biotin operon repressor/biotin-[acetyl-CoA-carboxylase] ligase
MKIKKYKIVTSTRSLAKKIKNPKAWQVIWAKEQTAGYGRENAPWFSPEGGLYFSIILPKSGIEDLQTLTILAAFVIAKTIKENFALEAFIKLPNDVFINQKKVAGVLTENIVGKDIKFSMMGIGLNTNIEKFPKDLERMATSLKIELGKEIDNEMVLKQIVEGIKEQLEIISQ